MKINLIGHNRTRSDGERKQRTAETGLQAQTASEPNSFVAHRYRALF